MNTCYNCEHYWGEIHNPDNPEEHAHDFCRLHGCFLNPWHKNGWMLDSGDMVYDDLECGEASCYLFEPKDEQSYPDEWFEAHKLCNKAVEEKLAEKAKEEGWYWE